MRNKHVESKKRRRGYIGITNKKKSLKSLKNEKTMNNTHR